MIERDDPYFLKRFDEIVTAASHHIARAGTNEQGRNEVNDLYRLAFAQRHLLAERDDTLKRLREGLLSLRDCPACGAQWTSSHAPDCPFLDVTQ